MSQAAIAQIQKAIADKKEAFGPKEAKKQLSTGKVAKIYLTSNCAAEVEQDMTYYAKLSNVEVEKLALTNEELSILCKKAFLVNVVTITQ